VRLQGEAYAPEVDDALQGRWPIPLGPRAEARGTQAAKPA
jgi:hypothetical protein